MSGWFLSLGPTAQALVAGLFTWGITAAGAALVFLTRRFPARMLDAMLGFAAGVMIAASVWSLLLPAIDMAEARGVPGWVPAAIGFGVGGAFLRLADHVLPHLHPGLALNESEGPRTRWQRGPSATTLGAAIALTIGIGLQNFPEGIAVAMPLRAEGMSRGKSFWYGQLSAVVEPVAAVGGAVAVVSMQSLLPYALSFAAGAMIYVVVEELIPESQQSGHSDLATLATMGGFMVMMVLDVALG